MIPRKTLAGLAVVLLAGVLTFHPSRPLYMRHQAIDVVSGDGTVLAGTLSTPRWRRKPIPGVVLVHGSGPLAREHLIGDVRGLVRRGFGVLAYDKRGVGASGGTYPQGWGASAENVLRILAADAQAALERLRKESDIDPTRVGFFGASQAGWIIPLASHKLEPPPRFNVILSGAAVSTGVEELYSQLTGDGHRPPQSTDEQEIRRRIERFDGEPGFDPAPTLAESRVPTLWLLGDRDQSVPTFATVQVIESLQAAGNGSHTVVRYPRAGHDLRDVDSGASMPVWEDVVSWSRQIGVMNSR